MSATPVPEAPTNRYAEIYNELMKSAEKWATFNRLVTTEAKIAQTPKKLIWSLNKAKLYRYIPTVPPAEMQKTPLLLVFAIMNRPHVLDLRPDTVSSNTCATEVTTFTCSIGARPARKTRT